MDEGMEARAFSDESEARKVAYQYNAVLVEVSYDEGDLKPMVDTCDFEFRDDEQQPMPGKWVDVPAAWNPHGGGWIPAVPPVIRVGKDAPRDKPAKI